MAKVLKMESSPLDAAVRAIAELRSRHDRERNKLAEARQRQEDLRDRRTDPSVPFSPADQQEAIGLSHEISDAEGIIADLEARILQQQEEVQSLTKEQARLAANVLVGQSMSDFDDVMKAFNGPVQRATDWLRKAQEAARQYARSNPGSFTSVNRQLEPKIQAMGLMLINIENGKKV